MILGQMRRRRLNFLAMLVGLLVLVPGCSTPEPKLVLRFGPKESLQNYRKVHILPPVSDPRMLQVKFLTRLRALGFDADVVDREKGIGRSQGTAFVVSREGHLLTCAHVLGANEQATVWLAGTNHEARIVHRDEKNDLALLKLITAIDRLPAPIPAAQSTNYPLGQDVFTIGFPLSDILGSSPRLTKGLVSAAVGLNDDPGHLQVSVEIQPGSSGGPRGR